MNYILKNQDMALLKFTVISNLRDPEVKITWHDERLVPMLPLDLKVDDKSLAGWLKSRTIPRNRAFVNAFLAKCGLSINRPMDNFIGTAQNLMEERHREQLRHLLTFRLEILHSYNLPAKRRKFIAKQIQKRARLLLEN